MKSSRLIPLLLDYEWQTVGANGSAGSLLTMPAGRGTVLDHLLSCIGHDARSPYMILPLFDAGHAYRTTIGELSSSAAAIVSSDALRQGLQDHEASDQLVVADPICWPIGEWSLSEHFDPDDEFRGATHFVALGTDVDRTVERVECDDSGRVKRVERVYQRVNWPHAASNVFVSVVPSRAIGTMTFQSASDLRQQLCACGVVSRDVALSVDVIGLAAEAGLLALNERLVIDELRARRIPHGNVERSNGTNGTNGTSYSPLIGRGCEIHSSVRLVGPVVIQDGVTLERGVSIIGPAVLGAGTIVSRDAIIAQSVLARKSWAMAGTAIVRRAVAGELTPAMAIGGSDSIDAGEGYEPLTIGAHSDGPIETMQDSFAARRRAHLVLKRLMDFVFSTLALLLLAPFLLLVAILIKLDSRGPVLFAHRREQRGGKEFSCWKFRTMVSDAHQQQRELYKKNEVDGPQFKLSNDPRTTRIGHVLRVTNIDELPQLINVWLGHMSMVGPRPSPFRENQICVPWRRARLSVPPGITGLWQLCRHDRGGGDFHQWIYYDMLYIRRFSIWLDIKILSATVLSLAGRWSIPADWLVKTSDPESEMPISAAASTV